MLGIAKCTLTMAVSEPPKSQLEWYYLRKEFLEESRSSGISAPAFLKARGINVNTGRRQFGELAKLGEAMSDKQLVIFLETKNAGKRAKGTNKGVAKSDHQSDRNSDQVITRSPRKRSATPKAKSNKNSDKPESNSRQRLISNDIDPRAAKRLTTRSQQDFRDQSSDMQIGNGGLFQRGNTAAVSTGAYMELVNADEDIKSVVSAMAVGDVSGLIKLETVRYLQMTRLLNERIEVIKTCPESDLPRDENQKIIPREDLLRQALWGASPGLSNAFSTISMASTQAAKAEADIYAKLSRLEREAKDKKALAEIMSERTFDENGDANMPAYELVRKIEAAALKPPPLLIQEALKEISLMAPKVDDSGMSDDELDALVLEYEEQANKWEAELIERAMALPELFAKEKAAAEAADAVSDDEYSEGYTGIEHLSDSDEPDFDPDWDEED